MRNRDVPLTYLTNGLWQAFVLTELLPFAVILLQDPNYLLIARVGWTILAMTALVYLTRSAVLRGIETHADVRAAAWDPGSNALRQLLSGPPKQAGAGWLRVPRRHPSAAARRRAVEEPQRTFRLGFWEMLAAGVAAGTALWNLTAGSLPGHFVSNRTIAVLSALVALLIVGVLGPAVWRAVAFARATGRPMPGVITPGIGLGTGLLFSTAASFDSIGATPWQSAILTGQGTENGASAPATVVVALLGLTGAVMLAAWVRSCAQVWLVGAGQADRNHRARRWLWPLSLAAMSLIAAVGIIGLIAAAYAGESLISGFAPTYPETIRTLVGRGAWIGPTWLWATVWNPLIIGALDGNGVIAAAAAVLWAFPAAGLWGARSAELRLAVQAGAGGGAVSAVLLVALRLAAHAHVPPSTRSEQVFQLLYAYWQVGLVVAAQAVVAVVVAALISRQAGTGPGRPVMIFSMLAAFVTAMISLAAICLSQFVGGCVRPMRISAAASCPNLPSGDFLSTVLRMLIVEGTIAALIGGTLGIMERRLLKRRIAGLRSRPVPATRRTLATPVILIATMLAVLAWGAITGPSRSPASPTETALDNSVWDSPADPTPLTPIAVRGWLKYGGAKRMQAFAAQIEAVRIDLVEKNNLKATRTACATIVHDSAAAASLGSVPDTEAQSAWSASISAGQKFAAKCVTSIDSDNPDAFGHAVPQYNEAKSQFEKSVERIKEILTESPGPLG